MPARVEGVIKERIGRLPPDLYQLLTIASVEGEEFTAEVVAAVSDRKVRDVVRLLGNEAGRSSP